MNFSEILNNAIAYITVIGGIGIFMIGLAKINEKYNLFKIIADFINKPVVEKLDVIDKEQKKMKLDVLALKIVSKGLPEETRYHASKEYLLNNGNSGVDILAKNYIDTYAKKHKLDI